MSLMPSNMIAANDNPGKTMFPNLARREDLPQAELDLIDTAVKGELEQAGIKIEGPFESFRKDREVPTAYLGTYCLWGFQRAWYYWIAKGPGIPADKAEEFYQTWGTQCRVMGHCESVSPLEYLHGFSVGLYHIDTQEGLNAFAKLLKSIYQEKT